MLVKRDPVKIMFSSIPVGIGSVIGELALNYSVSVGNSSIAFTISGLDCMVCLAWEVIMDGKVPDGW